MLQIVQFLQFIKPVFNALDITLMVVATVFCVRSIRRHFDVGLLCVSLGFVVSTIIEAGFLILGIQTQWKIVLLPTAFERQIVYLICDMLYPVALVLFPVGIIKLARRNGASPPPLPLPVA